MLSKGLRAILPFAFLAPLAVHAAGGPQGFRPARVETWTPPEFSELSIVDGTVIVEVEIGRSGKIRAFHATRNIPGLTEDAERTLEQWKFRPASFKGVPVKMWITAVFSYIFVGDRPDSWDIKPLPNPLPDWYPARVITGSDDIYYGACGAPTWSILELSLDKAGAISDIKPFIDYPCFVRSAEQTIRKWTFTPARYGGNSVASSVIAAFAFRPLVSNSR